MTELACSGGAPVRTEVLPGWPEFDEDEIEAVARVLRSGKVNYWTGNEGRRFEEEFAERFQMPHGVCVANGTVALELALHALGIGPGADVIVAPRTFVASASAVVMRGANPVFADVDETSQNITAESIRAVLSPRTRAVIVVHLAGWPCDMTPIMELATEAGLSVIEDCAQAHGATHMGRPAGSFGDASAFSFCQDKIMTTGGEGGMLLLRDYDCWARAWSFKDHGKSFEAVYKRNYSSAPYAFRWLHESIGTNWRMTEMQSAIGRVQLRKLDDWLVRRRRNAARLTSALGGLPGLSPTDPPKEIGHAFYKYYAQIILERLRPGWDQSRIIEAINAEGIACLAGACPEVYRERAFEGLGCIPGKRLPIARRLGERTLMLMVHPTLADRDIDDTANAVAKVMKAATRTDPRV